MPDKAVHWYHSIGLWLSAHETSPSYPHWYNYGSTERTASKKNKTILCLYVHKQFGPLKSVALTPVLYRRVVLEKETLIKLDSFAEVGYRSRQKKGKWGDFLVQIHHCMVIFPYLCKFKPCPSCTCVFAYVKPFPRSISLIVIEEIAHICFMGVPLPRTVPVIHWQSGTLSASLIMFIQYCPVLWS